MPHAAGQKRIIQYRNCYAFRAAKRNHRLHHLHCGCACSYVDAWLGGWMGGWMEGGRGEGGRQPFQKKHEVIDMHQLWLAVLRPGKLCGFYSRLPGAVCIVFGRKLSTIKFSRLHAQANAHSHPENSCRAKRNFKDPMQF